MPKLNEMGPGSIECQPKYTDKSRATQKTLFQLPPPRQLEPQGNAAYEGVGYPAAGYGQSRRQVVGLTEPKKATALSVRGWEDKQPQMKMTTIFTLNPKSNEHTRAELSTLMGLGCHCTKTDRDFAKALDGIGAVVQRSRRKQRRWDASNSGDNNRHSSSDSLHGLGQNLTQAQQLADAIITGVVPNSILSALTVKIINDEKANAEAYKNIQKLKLIDPQNRSIETLTRAQQSAWGQTNTAKFYALLIPEMQSRLGFTGGTPRVTPPDFKFIKSGGDPGVFTRVADFLRDQMVGAAAQQLKQAGYMKDSTGLAGLGAFPIVLGPVAAALIAAGIITFMVSTVSSVVQANSRAAIVATCATGKLSKSACAAALEASAETDWGNIAFYGAIGIGGLVALQVISSVRSAFPGR